LLILPPDGGDQVLDVAVGAGDRAVDQAQNLPAGLGREPDRDPLTNLAPGFGIADYAAFADLLPPGLELVV
jgi:hypothetical protein